MLTAGSQGNVCVIEKVVTFYSQDQQPDRVM